MTDLDERALEVALTAISGEAENASIRIAARAIGEAAIRAYLAAQWQPIETAPEDRTILLARIRDGQVFWCSSAKWAVQLLGHTTGASIAGWYIDGPSFFKNWRQGSERTAAPGFLDKAWPPTHWMPLPEPPEVESHD